jgi:isopentenyl diphosphate isomerase/L-lactate dehydrogenase-like FMN-dependent dehydrogenase
MKKNGFSRRKALAALTSFAAVSTAQENVARQNTGPKLAGEPAGRIAPAADLVNVLECEEMAARSLAPRVYAAIAGGDRSFFERITFRPRMMVSTMNLDLTVDLFGQKMFAPIIVGPMARQQQYHPEGELAAARGASAAKAVMVASSASSFPLDKIAVESKSGFWYQVFPEADLAAVKAGIAQATKAGCKAVCITVGAPYRGAEPALSPAQLAKTPPAALNWSVIDQLRQGVSVPFVIKGIMTAEEADLAVKRGVQGIVVSNYGGILTKGMATPIEVLSPIVDAVGGRVPVLVDGGFRRGSDIFKALALGATAVLLGRPAMWGLAAYGAEGVQTVVEMLQTEVGRDMGHAGKPNIKSIDRSVVKIHQA